MKSKQYYCYIHFKPNGDPFYVGKGHGNRAYVFSQRNRHHKIVTSKYGAENIDVLVMNCPSEAEAFYEEMFWIYRLREEGYQLVNYSDGGEGPSGYKFTPGQLKNLSEAHIGIIPSPETIARRVAKLKGQKRTPEVCARIAASNLGKKRSRLTRLRQSFRHKNRTPEEKAIRNANIAAGLKNRPKELKELQRIRYSATTKGVPWSEARRKAQELINHHKESRV